MQSPAGFSALRPRRYRCSRSRTPSQAASSGGISTQISGTPLASSARRSANSACAAAAASAGIRHSTVPATAARALRGIYRQRRCGRCRALCLRRRARAPDRQRRVDLRGRHQPHLGGRRVVRLQRARARGAEPSWATSAWPAAASISATVSRPGQQHRPAMLAAAVDDGRLDADLAVAAVEHPQVVLAGDALEFGHHMRGLRRADAAEAVGASARPRRARPGRPPRAAAPARPDDRDSADRRCPGRRRPRRPPLAARHDDRQRPRPEGRDQAPRSGSAPPSANTSAPAASARARSAGDRSAGPWRRRSCDRLGLVGACAQAVDRLGRQCDQLAGGQARGGFGHRGTARRASWRRAGAAWRGSERLDAQQRRGLQRGLARVRRRRAGDRQDAPSCDRAARTPCRTGAGSPWQRQHRGPVGRALRVSSVAKPEVAQEVQHHGGRMQPRLSQAAGLAIARTCRSNCDRSQESIVWWLELCGRGAISLATSEPSWPG